MLDKNEFYGMLDSNYIYGSYNNYIKSAMVLKDFKMRQNLISAKEIVRKYRITYQTVNHYTNFNLLEVVTKKGNVRMYDEAQVRYRLVRIAQLISEGYPLRLVCKKLNEHRK